MLLTSSVERQIPPSQVLFVDDAINRRVKEYDMVIHVQRPAACIIRSDLGEVAAAVERPEHADATIEDIGWRYRPLLASSPVAE